MGAATVTIQAGLPGGPVMGKYVCASTVSLSYVNIGFVPRMVQVINATDKDVGCTWTHDMTAAHGMTDAGAAITSRWYQPGRADRWHGTWGSRVETDASVQEAPKEPITLSPWR